MKDRGSRAQAGVGARPPTRAPASAIRRVLPALLVLCLGPALPSWADRPAQPRPAAPPTPPVVVEQVLRAFEADDTSSLAELAALDDPDPWVVADELCRREAHAAALAFAKAAPRTDVERLPHYVERLRTRPTPRSDREAFDALLAAFHARDWRAALVATDVPEATATDVTHVRIAYGRSQARFALGEAEAGLASLVESGRLARELGWLLHAQRAYVRAGMRTHQLGDWQTAMEVWPLALELAEARDDGFAAADALTALARVHAGLSHVEEALVEARKALAHWRELRVPGRVAGALNNVGLLHWKRAEYAEALEAMNEALALLGAQGRVGEVARTLSNVGRVHMAQGHYGEALRTQLEAIDVMERLNDSAGVAGALDLVGVIHEERGDLREALAAMRQALTLRERLSDRGAAAKTLGNMANVWMKRGHYPKAEHFHREALRVKEELGDEAGAAITLGNLGVVQMMLGDFEEALRTHTEALGARRALKDRAGAANSLTNLGLLHLQMGDFAGALRRLEEALAIAEEIGADAHAAEARIVQSDVYLAVGDDARALAILDSLLEGMEEREDDAGRAMTLSRIGVVLERRGKLLEALERQRSALEIMRRQQNRPAVAGTLTGVGILHRKLKDHAESIRALEEAQALFAELRDPGGETKAVGHLGLTYAAMGEHEQALGHLEDALDEARSRGLPALLAEFGAALARLRLDTGHVGQLGQAIADAREARKALEDMLGGLGEEQGVLARAVHAEVYAVGALVGARLDRPAEVFTFLESGRAGALLESLDGRRALQRAELPEELRDAEVQASAEAAVAQHDYERARDSRKISSINAARVVLGAANQRVLDVHDRIHRDAKSQAQLFYPRPASLRGVQRDLPGDSALVVYGLCLDEALALVVTSTSARIVLLGRVRDVEAACEALDLRSPKTAAEQPVARLRSLLAEPLDLPETVRTVLVSPEGVLCYQPFSLLFEGRDVVFTPSGTTHVLLVKEERSRGEGVLALGDPDYSRRWERPFEPPVVARLTRGSSLQPLPGTKEEVEAIGDVILLGKDATESKLLAALGQRKHWRAVHLACHGLVDDDRPWISSLALSRSDHEGDDGRLTILEVLRTRIPADLVVLSACDTGAGMVVKGEGIVSLSRAFMYAGAPRVVCSLWKVDDDATRILMEKFYELWNPDDESTGLPAAVALRAAQEHVKSQEDWAHPYYWAAWVLWGLPD